MSTGTDRSEGHETTAQRHGSSGVADLGRRAARGGVVVIIGQAARISVQVATVMVMARLLTPRDYGLVAMVMSVMAVANLVRDLGLSTAAIQAESLSKAQQHNLFWINTGVGGLLSVLALVAAPVIAWIYGEPALAPVATALAGVFFLNGMATQYRADLNRRMRFGRLMVADVTAPLLGLPVAAVMAVHGAEYWALVGQQLVQYSTGLVMVALMAGWLPGRPRRGVPMTGFLRFGWALVGSQLVNYVANNVDSLMIGIRLGAVSLGTYNRAYQLLMNPLSQVRGPTTTVALPVLSRLRHDTRAFQRFVERGQVALGYTIVTGLGVLIGASAPICAVFLGPRWDVAPVFALLAVAGAFDLLAYVGYWVYLAEGLMPDLLRYTFVAAAIKVVCVVGGSWWGITGVAAGYALAPALCWPLSLWWLTKHASVSVRPLYAGAGRIIGVTTLIAIAARAGVAVVPATAPVAVAAGVGLLAGAGAYVGLALVVPAVSRDVRGLGTTLRGAMRRSSDAGDERRPQVWGTTGEAVEPAGGAR
jgi:O-antigen/teichoic acid export membrane protein